MPDVDVGGGGRADHLENRRTFRMQTAQIIADAAEDGAIRRYRQLAQRGAMNRRVVQLPCGRCGAVQGVVVQDGMRVVAFACASCHQRTTAQVR
jgi:hypothetical protein